MDGDDTIRFAERAMAALHPQARCGFLAGSRARGDATPRSDVDLVILYAEGACRPHRHSLHFGGLPVELFVHTPRAQDWFFEKDTDRGVATMAFMVAEGLPFGPDAELAAAQKAKARAVLAGGPKPLSAAELGRRLYEITDLVTDLEDPRPQGETLACLSLLMIRLADMHLRANGHWSGTGKSLFRRLAVADEALAQHMTQAFSEAFQGDPAPAISLADQILAPHGGRRFEGTPAYAPDDWKTADG